MADTFVNLHTHSYYSILAGTMPPKRILELAAEQKAPAVALTDTGVGYGLLDFLESSAKVEGVKPIVGVEVLLSESSRFEKRPSLDGNEKHLVLLVQNQKGYENLLQLISKSHLEGYFNQPRIDWELLEAHAEGLICLSGTATGHVAYAWQNLGEAKTLALLERLNTLFSGRFYLELCARPSEEQKQFNQWLAQQAGYDFVVTSAARFATQDDEEAAHTLYCIGQNVQASDASNSPLKDNWFKPWAVLASELNYLPAELLESARKNTLVVAEGVDFQMQFGQDLLPDSEVPEGQTIPLQLRQDCEVQIPVRYVDKALQAQAQERLDYELSVIGKMGFESYFLIVADFINFAKDNGISVGPGRGSAAGSIVSYLLGITNIDPLHYELLFERFLNPERISMPDIDIDFSDERRDEVLQYVIEKYGTERVSKVCTFGTLAAKAALKDVGRAHGVPFALMNQMTKLLPNRPGFNLDEAEKIKEFTNFVEANPSLKKIFTLGKALEGCVRHVSVHACAVIIGKDDLSFNTPLQWAPGAEELKITQFPYQQLEHVGLLKMDFLGLKNLTVLEKTIQNIEQSRGETLDLNAIPLDDKATFSMLSEGETTGVFQFESSGMRRYLRELKPTEIEDLVAMNALYRPGPMEYIPQYIEGKHNPKKVKYLHDDLKPILQKTYGIAVYQEQVLRIAQEFAGFSLGEADILRKAIGKKIASILAEQREKFIDGAVAKGYVEKLAIKIFDDIVVPFSGYGFNRSHAVCYARIAYETAYLRANYPVEFMAAMMTTDRNNTDRIVLEMNECQSMGIEVLPPSVNESGSHFTVIKQTSTAQLALEKTPPQSTLRKIILISGPPGAGKSSTAEALAETLDYTHLEVDTLKHQHFGDQKVHEDPKAHGQLYDLLERKILENEESLVISYVFGAMGIERLESFFKAQKIQWSVTFLQPSINILKTRNADRKHPVEESHVLSVRESFEKMKPEWKTSFLDNSRISIAAIVADVMKKVEDEKDRQIRLDRVKGRMIRFGLTAIKGLGEETVNQIIFERNQHGKFESLQDFAKRVPAKLMNKKTLEALGCSGAFDAFGDRKAVVDSLEDLAKFARDYQEKADSGQMGLFGGTDEAAIEFTLRDTVATKEDILKWERESLGLFVSDHPLKGLNDYFEKYGSLIGALNEAEDVGKVRTLHGLVTSARQIITKAGKNMAILEIEDTSGKIEAAIFPQMYSQVPRAAMEVDAFVRVRAKIEDREGKLNAIVNEAKLGDLKNVQSKHQLFTDAPSAEPATNGVYEIAIPAAATKAQIAALKTLLRQQDSPAPEAQRVQVLLQGQVVDLPIKVLVSDVLENLVAETLG